MTLMTCFLFLGQAFADNVLTVSDVNVPQGGLAAIEIGCDFDTEFTAFELQLSLPEGLSLLCDEDGKPVIERAFDGSHVISGNLLPSNGNYKFTCYSTNANALLLPTTGILFRLTVAADENLPLNSVLNASITAAEFTRLADSKGENLPNVAFDIHVTEFRTILDESSTTLPETAEGVNVRVLRTIKADEWSTICLPFSMTEEQVKSAFGEDVELADFSSWSSEEDDDGNIIAISVGFTDVAAIEANHPYIIKVKQTITEFTAEDVDIDAEEEPSVMVGKKKAERGYMIGNYIAGTAVPEDDLFLNGNKFWYSKGASTMKAFRAYFEFADVLTDVEGANARILMSFFGDEATGISSLTPTPMREERIYSLSGMEVTGKRLGKGLYIRNGMKIVIK